MSGPTFWEFPHSRALPIEAKFIMNQTYVDYQAYEGEGSYPTLQQWENSYTYKQA